MSYHRVNQILPVNYITSHMNLGAIQIGSRLWLFSGYEEQVQVY
jgi:hypothetical protein